MARKTFKFRLCPNRLQRERLTQTLDVCRELYNAGLAERIGAWRNRTPVRVFDQINQLSSFLSMLRYKAENAGRQLIEVDPNYTSQECPQCHAIAKKALSERVHRCGCGLTIGRDHAAALLILERGLRLQAQTDRHFATVA
jgi:transposase